MSYNIDTGIIRFTVVGANDLKTTLYIFRRLGINAIKRINEGSFGNFRTKTYEMHLCTDELKPVMAAESSLLVTERQRNALDLYIFYKCAFL